MRLRHAILLAAFAASAGEGDGAAGGTGPEIHGWLAITGGAILGGTWAVGAGLGLTFMTLGAALGDCPECFEVGAPLLVPVAGPFAAAVEVDEFGGRAAFSALGVAQTAGLALGTAGLVRLARDVRARRTWRASHGGG
jgi:hypothetical protein